MWERLLQQGVCQVRCARAAGPAGWAAVPYDTRVEAAQRLASTGALRSLDTAVRLQLAQGGPGFARLVGCCAIGTLCTMCFLPNATVQSMQAVCYFGLCPTAHACMHMWGAVCV